jgi:hypothetical protein
MGIHVSILRGGFNGGNESYAGKQSALVEQIYFAEHREAMQRQDENNLKQVLPILDEHEQVGIDRLVRLSLDTKTAITLRVFGEFEDRLVSGVVVRIDSQIKQIKLASGDGEEDRIWVLLILGAEEIDATECVLSLDPKSRPAVGDVISE